jgi:hypothetical protein
VGATVTALDIAIAIERAFSDVDAVEGVYVCGNGPVLRFFTVINEEREDVYDLIYEREKSVRRSINEKLRFNVIARRGRCIGDVVSGCTPVWQRPLHEQCHNVTSI